MALPMTPFNGPLLPNMTGMTGMPGPPMGPIGSMPMPLPMPMMSPLQPMPMPMSPMPMPMIPNQQQLMYPPHPYYQQLQMSPMNYGYQPNLLGTVAMAPQPGLSSLVSPSPLRDKTDSSTHQRTCFSLPADI